MSSPFDDDDDAYGSGADGPSEESAPALVVVVDTGLIIDIKVKVPVNEQWALLHQMLELVKRGRLAFPSKVHRELTDMKWPEHRAPGAARRQR